MVPKKIKTALSRYKRLLLKNGFKVEKLLLYGSYAKGEQHRWSDIDVCIIAPEFVKNRSQQRLKASLLAHQIDPAIEIVPYSPRDWSENLVSPLLDQIRKTGVPI